MELNGHETLPTISVAWDAKTQAVNVGFNTQEFQSFEFVLAVLDMAKEAIKTKRQHAQMAALQRQQVEAMQSHDIAKRLKLGR